MEVTLKAWDADAGVYRKLICNADGKLIIDPSEIFEDPPTDGETGKAPNSNWAFDHAANAAAHHAKYTDAESRGAINNILNSLGKLTADLPCNLKQIALATGYQLIRSGEGNDYVWLRCDSLGTRLLVQHYRGGVGWTAVDVYRYNGSDYEKLATEVVCNTKISDHAGVSDAHHAKYTDAEAQVACNLDGTLYWTCPGTSFTTTSPDVNDITKSTSGGARADADGIIFLAGVSLPDGATITGVVVQGDAGAQAETWVMRRILLSNGTTEEMATAAIGTEDTTITGAVVNNSLYGYYLYTSSLDTNDTIFGARISFTL